MAYGMTGQVVSEDDGNGHSVAITPASGSNNAAPGAIAPNGDSRFTTNYSYNSLFGGDVGMRSEWGVVGIGVRSLWEAGLGYVCAWGEHELLVFVQSADGDRDIEWALDADDDGRIRASRKGGERR